MADAGQGIVEALSLAALLQVGGNDVVDGLDHLVVGEGGADDLPERSVLVGAAAEGDLVEFLALLVDAEDADVAHVMMAAGVDAAGDLDLEVADLVLAFQVAEALGDALGDGDGSRDRKSTRLNSSH